MGSVMVVVLAKVVLLWVSGSMLFKSDSTLSYREADGRRGGISRDAVGG